MIDHYRAYKWNDILLWPAKYNSDRQYETKGSQTYGAMGIMGHIYIKKTTKISVQLRIGLSNQCVCVRFCLCKSELKTAFSVTERLMGNKIFKQVKY